MALETREEFLAEWKKVGDNGLFGPDTPEEDRVRAGNELYDARVLAYQVAEEGLNLVAHRYFHGMASVSLNFMLQLRLGEILPFLVGESMFHEGFIAGIAYERRSEEDPSEVGLGDEEAAVDCLGDRANIIRTREQIEDEFMPTSILAVLELQRMMQAMVEAKGSAPVDSDEKLGGGFPIIPPEDAEERGYH